MEVPCFELDVAMNTDEGLRVLGFDFKNGESFFRERGLKSESVSCEVRSVCFCRSVFSKHNCNSEGDKQT